MIFTHEKELVLGTIAGLCRGDPRVPVTISAVHHSFSDIDVSDLVLHLGTLLECGLIRNPRETSEKISNMYVITPAGLEHYLENIKKNPDIS